MPNINVKVTDKTMQDLKIIQAYYSMKLGVSLSQKDTICKLLDETKNLIQNTGESYPGRNWEFERNEFEIHQAMKGESNAK